MSESFAELFEQSIKSLDLQQGAIITGIVVDIDCDLVTVNAGLKSEGLIPVEQFYENGELPIKIGDEVHVALESLEDGFGETKLSRDKAKRAECWIKLESAFTSNEVVNGVINGKVKGGFTVDVNGIRAFLPGSLVDVRPIRDTTHLEGQELEFKVIKLDQKRNNVVVSRRSVLESENSSEREELLASLKEDKQMQGIVKNLTDYGAFVDLGGVDGLLHITDMSWKRIKHPSEIVNVGEEINVKVLKFDRERNRVSLGLKQLGDDPWVAIKTRYPEGSKVIARITNLTDYGCFAELEEGVEGLVHVSEMDWTNKNIHPSKVVQVGDTINVKVLDIDEARRRISLGIKQCKENPWEYFYSKFNKGDRICGTIKSITDFGLFIGLNGGIDGLVHLSDISWNNELNEESLRKFKKGDELETVILSIDPERERISLGIKQLEDDPFYNYISLNEKGEIVSGVVQKIDVKSALIKLDTNVHGILKYSDIMISEIVEAADISKLLNLGEKIEAKIITIDRKNRIINLSLKYSKQADILKDKTIKDKNKKTKDLSLKESKSAAAPATTIGDLIRAKMENPNPQEKQKN